MATSDANKLKEEKRLKELSELRHQIKVFMVLRDKAWDELLRVSSVGKLSDVVIQKQELQKIVSKIHRVQNRIDKLSQLELL